MIPLHEETNNEKTVCVQWLIGDAHFTGRRIILDGNPVLVGTKDDFKTLVKVSYDGPLVLVDEDSLMPYQRPENMKDKTNA